MSESKDFLTLKWGTLKGYDLKSEAAIKALEELMSLGDRNMSVMMQSDTAEQKEALCKLIDAIDGEIDLDWEGKVVSKEEAKQYVREY